MVKVMNLRLLSLLVFAAVAYALPQPEIIAPLQGARDGSHHRAHPVAALRAAHRLPSSRPSGPINTEKVGASRLRLLSASEQREVEDRRPRLSTAVNSNQLREDVRILAADEMEGRGIGTKGIAKAAAYLEGRLRAIGVAPAFGASYRQSFPIKTGVSLGPNNSLQGVAKDDWSPLGFSSSGSFAGPLAFVGYGMEAPPIGYREFEGIDLKGKVALMLRYEPQERDDASPFDGRRPSRWSALRYKTHQARERGAVAVIFVTGPSQDEDRDRIAPLVNDGPESPAGIPVLQVKTSVARKWLAAHGIDLVAFQRDVDRDLRPRSKVLTQRVEGRVDVKDSYATSENVAGMLRGRGPIGDQAVVIGAHYDHLGLGGRGSMKPNVQAVHNGADDNASGTAAVLHIAERLQRELRNVPNHRTIVFAFFSGEEVGLAGSSHFVANSPIPIARTVAMINLDMVGQMRDDRVVLFGSESAAEWKEVLDRVTAASDLKVTSTGDGYGPSDQTSFYAVQVPVLHLFTGAHDRYHTPEDDAASLNYEGIERIVAFTSELGRALAGDGTTPKYARAQAAPAMQGDSRGYGAYLGTVPDYSAMESKGGGVLISDVRPGSPAERAGLKGGDRLIEIGGTRIENLYDMTFALQDHKPGSTVDVVLMRNEQRMTLRATLSARGGAAPTAASAHPTAPAVQQTPAAVQQTPPAQPFNRGASTPEPATPVTPVVAPPSAPTRVLRGAEARPNTVVEIKAGKPFATTFPGEAHLFEVRQLTFAGENAEAYFSPDGRSLIYQASTPGVPCDRIYTLDLTTGETKQVSSGEGRTTCAYYDWPEQDRIIYASTELGGKECPPVPDHSKGYVWAIYPSYDIFEANLDGSNRKRLTTTPGYDAEATWCHRGGKFIFTSVRDGDLDLYEMNEAGDVRRLTDTPGYDGGAFYSADCRQIVWRASRPTGAALDEYQSLLKQGLVRPSAMEIFVMNADGTNQRQITRNGAANFGPYFHNDGRRIIYSSNVGDPRGREFELWMANQEGGEPERITFAPGFDGFPMFSPNGDYLVFASNRANPQGRETNLFIAHWKD